jgi:hypothetical protein
VAAPAAPSGAVELRPFSVIRNPADRSALDLSFLSEMPAGQDGPLQIVRGHLATPDGKPIRLWGVNLTDFAPGSIRFPAKADAAFWADALARAGVNCVRLHNMDVAAPRGIIAAGRDNTRAFDAEQLDRLDYFVFQLKRRGIYLDLNLNVGRGYQPGDGVADSAIIGAAKAITYFDPRVIELEEEYASQLLNHFNPYTRSAYRSEPAVAIVEIVNENSLIGAWIRGRLMGTRTKGPAQNWQDISPHYERELTDQFNEWLRCTRAPAQLDQIRRLAGVAADAAVPRLKPEQFAAAPRLRFETEAAFYAGVETRFFAAMQRLLKTTLGVKALLIGTSDFSYGKSDYPALQSRAALDIIDAHGPWELNAMVDEPLNSIPVRLSRSAVAGKPFTVSEHNHRFPSNYACEGIPLLAAYGAFQDWDGIFLYTFELKPPGYVPRIETRADLSVDPVKLANLAAGALIFRRGDVRAATQTVTRSYSQAETYDSLLLPARAGVYFTPGFSPQVALQHGSRIASFDGPPTRPLALPYASPIVSDTGELKWYHSIHPAALTQEDDQHFEASRRGGGGAPHAGLVTVDAARCQALIGFIGGQPAGVTHLTARIANPFASLVLCSLNEEPIAGAARLLLAATSRVANSGGRPAASPTLIETVTGRLVLRGLKPAAAVGAFPLDGAGRRLPQRVEARQVPEGWELRLGEVATTWYEIVVER